MDQFKSKRMLKQKKNSDSDGSDEENIDMRRNKFYNESTEDEILELDVEDILMMKIMDYWVMKIGLKI